MRKVKTIIAYTDGSAVVAGKNKGNGGFGTYFPDFFGTPKGISKGFENTKTGRTEISALYYAIKAFPLKTEELITLRVYSDSQYVVKAFTENRLKKWKSNGWKNTSGDVKNRDLWESVLRALNNRHFLQLDMHWIRGHQVDKERDPVEKTRLLQDSHIVGNMIADKLANRWRLGNLEKSDKL